MGRNSVHGSDSWESAVREIGIWFSKEELVGYKGMGEPWVYENDAKDGILSELAKRRATLE